MKHTQAAKHATLMAVAGIWVGTEVAASGQVTFTASGAGAGSDLLEATATFQTLPGNLLQITLANTETGDAHTTANLLTAIFFDGATGLAPVSAIVPTGQMEWNSGVSSTLGSDLNVGTQWAYAYTGGSGNESLGANPPHNATAGISSSGFGWFSHGDFAPSGAALDGAPYGLVPLGFLSTGGSHDGLTNGQSDPTFENTVVLTLSGWTGNVNNIANVTFQYGTATTDTALVPVPEPGTTVLVVLGGLCLMGWTVRQRHSVS